MSARQSSATDRALRLVARGVPAPEAARRAGIAYTTLWRALRRNKPQPTAKQELA